MRGILLIFLTVFSLNCLAEDYVRFTGLSWHSTPDNNPINAGVGFEFKHNKEWAWTGGTYRNSEYNYSWYAGARYTFYKDEDWNVGLIGGAVTGYRAMPVIPMLMPDVCWNYLCVGALPKVSKDGSNVVAFSVKLPIQY
jgi:hypothetical protein